MQNGVQAIRTTVAKAVAAKMARTVADVARTHIAVEEAVEDGGRILVTDIGHEEAVENEDICPVLKIEMATVASEHTIFAPVVVAAAAI